MSIRLYDQALPHGITLSCRAAGRADAPRRVVLLHGFPEAAFVWDDVMAALAPQALCVAPNLRGYEHSSAPHAVEQYRPKHLVADVAALIDQLGAPIDLLVAHDWGGGLAWNLAALSPQRLKHLVILNSPHPATFVRELQHSAEQQHASAYMLALVQPDAAQGLAANDFAELFAKLDPTGQAAWLTPDVRAQYRAVWSRGLDPALNYYRASPLRPPSGPDDGALAQLQLPDSVTRINVPTTVLWGEADHALRPGLLDGLQHWVPRLTVHRRADASHWLVHEHPDWVIAHLRALLDDPKAGQ
jgi:pimeloyl-ACP methyl ester carboxylesterase